MLGRWDDYIEDCRIFRELWVLPSFLPTSPPDFQTFQWSGTIYRLNYEDEWVRENKSLSPSLLFVFCRCWEEHFYVFLPGTTLFLTYRHTWVPFKQSKNCPIESFLFLQSLLSFLHDFIQSYFSYRHFLEYRFSFFGGFYRNLAWIIQANI